MKTELAKLRLLAIGSVAMALCLSACGTEGDPGPQGEKGEQGEQGLPGNDAVFPGTDTGTGSLLIAWSVNGESSADSRSCPDCVTLCTENSIAFFTFDARDEDDVTQCSAAVSCEDGRWWSADSCEDIPAGLYRVEVTANAAPQSTGPVLAFRKQSVALADGDYAEVRVGFSSLMDF